MKSKRLRILMLEDVSTDAKLIERELRLAGIEFAAVCVDSRRGFIEGLEQLKPDIIISDFTLPQFNALQALEELRGRGIDLPFVLVTGSQSEEVAVECIKKGADDYILKSSLKRLPSAVSGAMQRRAAARERAEWQERIQEQAALLDKAQDAIVVHDLENVIRFWNKSAERLYGWRGEEALGQDAVGVFSSQEGSERWYEARRVALERGEWHGELRQRTKSGTSMTVESRWTLVSDRESRPRSLLVINTDITERKRLEAQFLRMQRMESIGTLASGIAHDLNNVFTPISVAIKLLRDEVKGGVGQGVLDTLEASALRGANIVQQVVSFARGVEGEKTIIQVKHPLNEVIGIVKETFPRSVYIQSRIEKNLWPVLGEPTQLHQVFMNLCVNARDAMPQGGRMTIDGGNVVLDENYARMQAEAKAGPYVVVSIADTGTGIRPELLSKIFEPFFTTKEMGKGTGLGLSTALGIVRSHGGFITVYSELGKGTQFKVHLPAVPDAERKAVDERTKSVRRGEGELVLVADDEFAVREIVQASLESNGYRVRSAKDGTEVVAQCARLGEEVRAVILDVMMPYMDGPSTIRAVQKLNPAMGFIAMSGLTDNNRIGELSEAGRVRFLAKPFTTEQLLEVLADLLRGT